MPNLRHAPERLEGSCADATCVTGGMWASDPPASPNAKNLMLGAVPLSRAPAASPWLHPAPALAVPPGLVTRDMSYQSCCTWAAESCATRHTSRSAAGSGPAAAPGV